VSVTPVEIRPGAADSLAESSAATEVSAQSQSPAPATPGLAPPAAARIVYTLGRAASVAIYVIGPDGRQHVFRGARQSAAGTYTLDWGGVVNEPLLRAVPGGQETLQSWVLPQGSYRWAVEATDSAGQKARAEGPITIDASGPPIEVQHFTVVPHDFSPKQDGLRDNRVSVTYYLSRPASQVEVYLRSLEDAQTGSTGQKYPVSVAPTDFDPKPGDPGYHGMSWDGGVDMGAVPPPDGDYVIYAEAQDALGNRAMVTSTLSIHEGGRPLADIVGGDLHWQNQENRVLPVGLGQSLCFTATVANIGPVPIRTSGPWPGQLYELSQNSNTLAASQGQTAWYQQAGVWRLGVNYDNTGLDYPFRWAIGRPQDLEKRVIDGRPQYYLMPGHQGQVTGCVRFDTAPPASTRLFWGGLIQEYVAVVADQVDPLNVVFRSSR
jgi:hypothetical protein